VNELALSLGISRSVVQKYLRLLEQSFIIKVIYSFSTNPRVELKKAFKVFFYDNGVRNALVGLGTPLEQRNDRGAIWENFFFSERSKIHTLITFPPELMFWRTRKGLEIDFIEKDGQNIIAYECKWQPQHISFTQFLKRYSNAHVHVVSPTDMTQKDFPKELYFIEAKK
jgi:predicted AAA+ superfamily ATPase